MKITTQKLLDRLEALQPGSCRVSEAKSIDDSEIVYLNDDHFLSIDENAALPTVSLEEQMPFGGSVELREWTVTEDAILDEIVTTSLSASEWA